MYFSVIPAATFQNNADWNEAFDIAINSSLRTLKGARAFMQMRASDNAPAVLDLKSGEGLTLREADKVLIIKVPMRAMERISPGVYSRDIIVQWNEREVLFAGRGFITITPGITRNKDNSPWHLESF